MTNVSLYSFSVYVYVYVSVYVYVLFLSLSCSSIAFRYAILHANEPKDAADVQKKLLPLIGNVSMIVGTTCTPTAQQLAPFDALLVYSSLNFADPDALGDILADYVDSGKGVVVAVFTLTMSSSFPNMQLRGRFGGNGNSSYFVISRAESAIGNLFLSPLDSTHPIMSGVKTFDGGSSSFRGTGNWVADAHPVALWSDKKTPLIGTRIINGTRRVDLNFFPVSSTVYKQYWDAATDGAKIIANALTWVAETPCTPHAACGSCTANNCQWCLDSNRCYLKNPSCRNRIATPGDCPSLICSRYTKCSACLETIVARSCSWCLDNSTCVSNNNDCKGELNDHLYCSS